MEIFVDSFNVKEIKELYTAGLVHGVTTNPSLVAKSGLDFKKTLHEIFNIVDGPISVEVISEDYQNMRNEASKIIKEFKKFENNITIKLPITLDGIRLCDELSSEGIMTNMTLCFNPAQAILTSNASATFVSVFMGRLDDSGISSSKVLEDIVKIYDNDVENITKILAASIRSVQHIIDAFKIGADVVTAPANIIKAMVEDPLTSAGLKKFNEDWKNVNSFI